MKYLLGIDIGTQSIRVCLFNEQADYICGESTEQYVEIEQPSWASQNVASWWEIISKNIKLVLKKSRVRPSDILSIGCCAHMHAAIPIDQGGHLLINNVPLYCDKRATHIAEQISVNADAHQKVTGNLPASTWMGIKIKWFKENHPDLYEKTYKFLTPKDYINYCLTGECAIDQTEASGSYAMDWESGEWSQTMINVLDIDHSKLPQILDSFALMGTVSKQAADQTGLQEGTKVACGCGDLLASMYASGLNRDGIVVDLTATAATMCCNGSKPLFHPEITELKNVYGSWNHYGVLDAAGAGFRWVRDTIAKAEVAEAEANGINSYDCLSSLAQEVPAGASGLLYMPYLLGERVGGTPDSRGGFLGLHLGSTIADMVRAFLEGVAFDLKRTLDIYQQCGYEITSVYHVSGGAKGKLWNQIKADIYQKPLYTLREEEGSVMGAALMGGVCAELYNSPAEALDLIFAIGREYVPNPANKQIYEDIYGVFCELHTMLQKPYTKLADIQRSRHLP